MYDLRVFCFKQKTAYEMRISDWSSDVCSSDLRRKRAAGGPNSKKRKEPGRRTVPGADCVRAMHCPRMHREACQEPRPARREAAIGGAGFLQIGRASCWERVCQYV